MPHDIDAQSGAVIHVQIIIFTPALTPSIMYTHTCSSVTNGEEVFENKALLFVLIPERLTEAFGETFPLHELSARRLMLVFDDSRPIDRLMLQLQQHLCCLSAGWLFFRNHLQVHPVLVVVGVVRGTGCLVSGAQQLDPGHHVAHVLQLVILRSGT